LRKHLALVTAAVLLLAPAAAAEPPKVLVTIKPLHSLVAGVMAGVGTPRLLIQGAGSPHSYQMRPSDARALAAADLVFWAGEGLEAFLGRPLAALAVGARVVELAEVPGLNLLRPREGGVWEADGHEGEEPAHGHAREDGRDMHFWLDPGNATAMADAIAVALAETDAGNAARYRTNAEALKGRLATLDGELKASLAPIGDRPYIVFHDAYQYFERRYRLSPAGAITVSPEVAPGVARIAEIRQKIKRSGAACVFAEPQFEPKLARLAVEGTGARVAELDPLGAQLTEGPELYFKLLRGLAGSLRRCLIAQD
jgi:zinc transport system substrate-binding protein